MEKLRGEIRSAGSGAAGQSTGNAGYIASLENRLAYQQEELSELHMKRGENAQLVVDLNMRLQQKEKLIQSQEERLTELKALNKTLTVENQQYRISRSELEELNLVLRDEYQALQLEFTHLEKKLRKVQDENQQMVEKLMKYKTSDAEKLNEENENFIRRVYLVFHLCLRLKERGRKKHAKLQKELEDAAKDMRGLSPDSNIPDCVPFATQFAVPNKVSMVFDAHEGEVSAVKWSPVGRVLATGGADRKLKLWDTSKASVESKGMLVGSNAGVMSIDYDYTGTLVLGASNDFAARVWTVSDQRLRVSQVRLPSDFQTNMKQNCMLRTRSMHPINS
ncbi:hypothetical protein AAG570_006123 [Ranatra chinensis]|uniref:Autophagy-related protein 16 domain-containing protein n=1 Tax=Ranatra chinensis TaxID=642074 RepID=A0ABD0YA00_9HEMI